MPNLMHIGFANSGRFVRIFHVDGKRATGDMQGVTAEIGVVANVPD